MRNLNLGILAHVDAGKTSLTERLLYAAGVIDEIGSVDAGNTQTDSLDLERQRGITIKSAVVSFQIGDISINLIDTPGHPDFIAEVERVLNVLDGVVLVISAVEGVQPQTRVLMRTLQRLRIPTLLFINKIDRGGAREEGVLREISERLTPAIIPMGSANALGTRAASFTPFEESDLSFRLALAEAVAERDESVLSAYFDQPSAVPYRQLRDALVAQSRAALLHPIFFGSAITGAGMDSLTAAIPELLPTAGDDADGPLSASAFKIERGPAGEKIAYVRVFSGSLQVRGRVELEGREPQKVTSMRLFQNGSDIQSGALRAGQIGKLWGLSDVQIADTIGTPTGQSQAHLFAPPTLETAIVARSGAKQGELHVALSRLSEQDPLINLRQDDVRGELYVSLYGEVQKQVVEQTLAADFGIQVRFSETTPICIERVRGSATAIELLGADDNPFLATVGIRIDPAPLKSGVTVKVEAKMAGIPMHVFGTVEEFHASIESIVLDTFRQGIRGWQVADCVVTMTESAYVSPGTGSADYRKLAPLALMSALSQAGTTVCEPIHRFHMFMPADALGAILGVLSRLHAVPEEPKLNGGDCELVGQLAAARVHELQAQLPGLTHGEGVLETEFAGYRPVTGPVPSRPRTDWNPLDRKEYLRHLLGRF